MGLTLLLSLVIGLRIGLVLWFELLCSIRLTFKAKASVRLSLGLGLGNSFVFGLWLALGVWCRIKPRDMARTVIGLGLVPGSMLSQ
jgi:hypothetical protein